MDVLRILMEVHHRSNNRNMAILHKLRNLTTDTILRARNKHLRSSSSSSSSSSSRNNTNNSNRRSSKSHSMRRKMVHNRSISFRLLSNSRHSSSNRLSNSSNNPPKPCRLNPVQLRTISTLDSHSGQVR